jgi:hypothetical protein
MRLFYPDGLTEMASLGDYDLLLVIYHFFEELEKRDHETESNALNAMREIVTGARDGYVGRTDDDDTLGAINYDM